MATPVMTFLQDIDFSGKKVAGFYTYAGDGRDFAKDLQALAKNAQFLGVIGFKGTYDTGQGAEPDGMTYQQQRQAEISDRLDQWLRDIMR